MKREKVIERQFKAIQKSAKNMKTLDFVKDGYHYFGNGFQIVKIAASTENNKNVEQFEVVRNIFEEIETGYNHSVDINLNDMWKIFKGLKSSKLCKYGVTLDFDGKGNLTIKNCSDAFTPKIEIKTSYVGNEVKYNILLSVDRVYDILNALTSLDSNENVEMFFDPSSDLKPVLFYDGLINYRVVQPVMRKF